ncbi:probable BsuMI modification methylase subunit YdiP at N-terminal half [Coccomyxa sp. Obi]|nr:probable BsuMI modification methylase subunit YdiP at N-terminal half [Coccomyxa sp. Obi]
MRVASLFTGAGGLDIGLAQAGHTIIFQCESDLGAQQVLKRRFPGTLLVTDICAVVALPPETEIVAAGFPCIDVSRAGFRKGLDGQSTSLVRHMFRLLETALKDDRGIPWVLLENVEGLLDRSAGQPPVIQYVVEEFERLGYASWAHRIINTASFGAPNCRKRVFLVASLYGDARDVLLSQGFVCKGACYQLFNGKPCYLCHQAHGPNGRGQEPDCSFALDLTNAQSWPAIDVVPKFKTGNALICLLLKSGQLGMLRTEDAERLQGFEEGHTLPCFPIHGPGSCLHGAPSLKDSDVERRESHRWALLGNAVSVPVAAWLGERLAEPHRSKYYPGPKDRNLIISAAAAPQGSQQIHHAAASEWADIEDEPLVPKEELYEFQSPGEEACEEERAGYTPPGAGTGACQEAADPTLSEQEPMPSTPASDGDSEAAVEQKKRRIKDFQCKIMCQASNKPQPTVRQGTTQRADRAAWPRAAWYIRGLGRYAAEEISEAPLLRPMTLLGDFITKVGRAPDKEALATYFARMREQGFNMESVLRRAQQCGAALNQEAVRISVLQGYTPDVETIGTLVWARNTTGAWWPGEALDPHYLPPTRTIPPLAAAALTRGEYLASIPEQKGRAPPPPICIGSAVMGGAAAQHGIEGTAADNNAGADTPREPALRDTTSSSKRKVLVILFGKRTCMWHSPAQLLPFKRHLHEKLTEGNDLIEAKKMPRPHLFMSGVQEAKELSDLILDAAKEDAEAEKGAHQEALAALATTRAAAAKLRVRCGYCEACLATQGASRSCLVNRAAAAAVGGHSGAQVAVAGESAIGARISVWWPLDEDWYTGFVTAFDPIQQRHTICYDDGDVEIVCLWAPNQLVRVVTDPGEWPKQAERIATEQKLHNVATSNQQRRAGAAASQDPQDPAIMLDAPPLNEFEQQRVDNIARNKDMLANLVVPLAAEKAAGPATLAAQGKQAAGTTRSNLGDRQMPAGASRTGVTPARDSKGRFIGSSSSRRHARATAGPVQSSGNFGPALPVVLSDRASPGTVKRLHSSGMTVPVVEGSLAPSVACDMATWMQHEGSNAKNVTSLAAGQRHAGGDQQAADHAQEGPSGAGSHGARAALVLPEALANLGCEMPLQAAPPEAVRENLFGMAMTPRKGGKKRKASITTTTGASRIAGEM